MRFVQLHAEIRSQLGSTCNEYDDWRWAPSGCNVELSFHLFFLSVAPNMHPLSKQSTYLNLTHFVENECVVAHALEQQCGFIRNIIHVLMCQKYFQATQNNPESEPRPCFDDKRGWKKNLFQAYVWTVVIHINSTDTWTKRQLFEPTATIHILYVCLHSTVMQKRNGNEYSERLRERCMKTVVFGVQRESINEFSKVLRLHYFN